eukprot:g45496.t1
MVRWFKDGVEVRKGKKYDIVAKGAERMLIIHKSSFDDEAEYECDARTAKTSGLLTVLEEDAFFTKNLVNAEVIETNNIKLICEVSKPTAEVTWYKGDKELPEIGRYEQLTDGKKRILVIQNTNPDDAGEYNCRLRTARTSCELQVHELAPEFISRPQNLEVVEGDKAEFVCSVSKEAYEVKWFRGDKELKSDDKYEIISDGKKRVLVIKDSIPKDEGTYAAMIGTSRAPAELTVIEEELKIIEPLEDCETVEKKSVTFCCKVNRENATLKWMKNGEEITLDKRFLYKIDKKKHSLLIRNCTFKDEAVPVIQVTDLNLVIDAGKPFTMTLPYDSYPRDVPGPVQNLKVIDTSDGEVSLAWDEPETDGGSRIIGYVVERRDVLRKTWTLVTDHADNTEFTVTGLQKGVEYLFRISARNRIGTGEPVETETPVEAKNKFDVPDAPLNVQVKDVNKFGATITWEPPEYDGGAEITNYVIELRDRTSVKWEPAMTTKADELTAQLNDVVENREYIFRVRAENKAGVGKPSSASRPVKIMDPILAPTFDLRAFKDGLEVIVPEPLKIRIPISGYPIPIAKWAFKDKPLESNDRVKMETTATYTQLFISPSERPDKGLYKLTLENDVSSVTGEIDVNVIQRPSAPNDFKVSEIGRSTVYLIWELPDDDGGSPITGYLIEKREINRKTWTKVIDRLQDLEFSVPDLFHGKDYLFKVAACNKCGPGEPAYIDEPVNVSAPA